MRFTILTIAVAICGSALAIDDDWFNSPKVSVGKMDESRWDALIQPSKTISKKFKSIYPISRLINLGYECSETDGRPVLQLNYLDVNLNDCTLMLVAKWGVTDYPGARERIVSKAVMMGGALGHRK